MKAMKSKSHLTITLNNISSCVFLFTYFYTCIISFNQDGYSGIFFSIFLQIPAQIYYVVVFIANSTLQNYTYTIIFAWIFHLIVLFIINSKNNND